ncbi:TetR/AcrR family transcriptional regulator [Leucobacter sp. M11]|uniref:TetR/AcrR family transcriptional regulator n=1 Tax=Leucobacter sp. M11 TaxID=2993565 RepID=UPI002D7E584A|nr:helix-turn-helix domain-containing protein [Leucobacter sp. M11]MEB4615178.1 helix-turn-helix domain containing protein [Leucobacter sp. M11]
MTEQARPRGREREARVNDHAVLEAARAVFAIRGWDAPMSAIAEHAGVGVASIYRRYPSKEELVLELRLEALRDVTALATASLAEPEAATGEEAASGVASPVARFLRAHVRQAHPPLVNAYGLHPIPSAEVDALAEELYQALLALIAAEAAELPPGFTPADLMLGITHLRPSLPATPERLTEIHLRHVDLYLLGLRAAARRPELLSGTGSSWQEWLDLHNSQRPSHARH